MDDEDLGLYPLDDEDFDLVTQADYEGEEPGHTFDVAPLVIGEDG